jgi:hypothetical protein
VHRGPFTRWPRAADAVLAAVLFVLTLLLQDGPGDSVVLRDLDASRSGRAAVRGRQRRAVLAPPRTGRRLASSSPPGR